MSHRPSFVGEVTTRGWFYDYDSFGAFLANADEPFGDYRGRRSSQETRHRNWHGTATFQEAVELARDGWRDGGGAINKVQELLMKRLIAHIPTPTIVNDVVGEAYDIEALLRGEPEPAFRFEQAPVKRRAIDVTLNIAASAAVSTETMVARGGLMAGLVFAFDRMNIPSRVYVLSAFNGRYKQSLTRILVKGESEPLDVEKLAFALGHPAMFRRLMFCHQENSSDAARIATNVGRDYGYPGDVPEPYRGEVHMDKAGSWDAQWSNPDKAMKWIMDQLVTLGVIVDSEVTA